MYLCRLGCRVLEPCFPRIHPNMDGRRAPRFPKRVFHVARNAIFMVPDTRFHGSRIAPRFPKRVFMLPGTRFSWFPRSAFMVPETRFHGSRNAPSWFPKRAFMVPETTFHGSRNDLSWFPKRPPWFPKRLSWFPKCVHGSRNMVPEPTRAPPCGVMASVPEIQTFSDFAAVPTTFCVQVRTCGKLGVYSLPFLVDLASEGLRSFLAVKFQRSNAGDRETLYHLHRVASHLGDPRVETMCRSKMSDVLRLLRFIQQPFRYSVRCRQSSLCCRNKCLRDEYVLSWANVWTSLATGSYRFMCLQHALWQKATPR